MVNIVSKHESKLDNVYFIISNLEPAVVLCWPTVQN